MIENIHFGAKTFRVLRLRLHNQVHITTNYRTISYTDLISVHNDKKKSPLSIMQGCFSVIGFKFYRHLSTIGPQNHARTSLNKLFAKCSPPEIVRTRGL